MLALVCWEALAERRFPLLSCGVAAALWLTFIEDSLVRGSDPRVYAFTLAWVLPMAAVLGVRCLRSGPREASPDVR